MIICASPALQNDLLPWLDNVETCFEDLQMLEQYLQIRLQSDAPPTVILLDAECLQEQTDVEAQLARLHVLSHHKPVLLCHSWQLDNLPDAALDHVFCTLSLPLGARNLQLLQAHLRAEAEQLRQLAGHELRLMQLMDENRKLRQLLQQESSHDLVSGLLHRRAFEERLDKEWRRAHRHGHPLSAIALQFHGLKTQSTATEAFLSELCRRLKAVRASDIVGRIADDHFVMLLPMTFQEGAQALSTHFQTLTGNLIEKHELPIRLEVLCCSEIPRCHNDSNRFLTRLLTACHSAPGPSALLV